MRALFAVTRNVAARPELTWRARSLLHVHLPQLSSLIFLRENKVGAALQVRCNAFVPQSGKETGKNGE